MQSDPADLGSLGKQAFHPGVPGGPGEGEMIFHAISTL